MLVSTAWLAQRLGDTSIVVIHVGSEQEYAQGHIPGARLLSLAEVSVTDGRGLRLELPPVSALEATFGRLGVSGRSRIILYAGNDSVQSATRVWFTLDFLGAGNRTSLLDGGLGLWRAEGRPLSTASPVVQPGRFTARSRPESVVDAAWVQAHRGDAGVQLVDARAPEFYTGANAGGQPRAGHIPGARNVPFSSLFDAQHRMKPESALRELLGPTGAPSRVIVPYCHIGQQATVVYFSARRLGLRARLYDGSFQDWSGRPELPVVTGTSPK